jgi:hypothetical protein
MKTFHTTTIRLTEDLELNVEYLHYPAEPSPDRDVPGEPEMFEVDSIWLVEISTNNVIDVTDLESTLYQHDDILRQIEEKHYA